jgi:hypothetical protein
VTDQEIIALLDSYGHLRFNPQCPEGRNLTDEDVLKLTLDHPIVVAAIASYQRWRPRSWTGWWRSIIKVAWP